MTSIKDYFENIWLFKFPRAPISEIPLTEGAFPAFLEIDISENVFDVPMPLLPYVLDAKDSGCNKLVFNLINGTDDFGRRTFHKKTINTILRQFTDASRGNMRLAHIVTSKNLHYYGGLGMIFNGDYSPLLLATVEVHYDPSTRHIIELSHPKCKLSYKVFSEASEIVEKTIIKQAIPIYSNRGVDIYLNGGCYATNAPVEISVEHLDSLVVKPVVPTPSYVNPIAFNATIADYYETH